MKIKSISFHIYGHIKVVLQQKIEFYNITINQKKDETIIYYFVYRTA